MGIRIRDYKHEYAMYHSKPEQRRNRSERNKARRIMGLKVGDSREVDHIKPMKRGGGNNLSNLKITSRSYNRRKAAR